jgi:hypothetical protein
VIRARAYPKRPFNVAFKGLIVLKEGVPANNAVPNISLEPEHIDRDRALSAVAFDQCYQVVRAWGKSPLLVAYHVGM